MFILCLNFPPDNNKPYTVRELCAAAEERSGFNSVLGAQPMGGVWRLYPKTEDAQTVCVRMTRCLTAHSDHTKEPLHRSIHRR